MATSGIQVILNLCPELIGSLMPLPIRACFREWTTNRIAAKSLSLPAAGAILGGLLCSTIMRNASDQVFLVYLTLRALVFIIAYCKMAAGNGMM